VSDVGRPTQREGLSVFQPILSTGNLFQQEEKKSSFSSRMLCFLCLQLLLFFFYGEAKEPGNLK
jgi:hypothetical protein